MVTRKKRIKITTKAISNVSILLVTLHLSNRFFDYGK